MAASRERRITIFYTAEVRGAIEPCGCTSDPLGDISRYAEVVRSAKRENAAVLLVDAGSLLYPEGLIPAKERPAIDLRASFLAAELKKLGLAEAGAHVQTVGGVKVGLLGVADPAGADKLKATSDDPVKTARRDADRLRREGAEIVIALAAIERASARRLAREAGVDFVVLGRQVGSGTPRAEKVDRAFLVAPADELQRVGRIDLVLRDGAAVLVDAGGPDAQRAGKDEIERALARLDQDLAKWSKPSSGSTGSTADPGFVARKRREREELVAERERLAAPWSPPTAGSYFTNRLIPLRRSLPRAQAVVAAMKRLDARIASVNLKNAAPPPPPEPGRPFYVGMSKCGACHKAAVAFWNKTVHERAWETLVAGGKQADYKCIGCHVTGYGQVGGASLGHTKGLSDVQCETCHGPASTHVAARGLEDPISVHRDTPESTCLGCHNEHHSDTFQYQAYLRDVLGTGHGAAARKKLGDGPTGHSLRAAALAKAKAVGAAQLSAEPLKKM